MHIYSSTLINMELRHELQNEYPYLFGLLAREVMNRVYDEQGWARELIIASDNSKKVEALTND